MGNKLLVSYGSCTGRVRPSASLPYRQIAGGLYCVVSGDALFLGPSLICSSSSSQVITHNQPSPALPIRSSAPK